MKPDPIPCCEVGVKSGSNAERTEEPIESPVTNKKYLNKKSWKERRPISLYAIITNARTSSIDPAKSTTAPTKEMTQEAIR